MDELVLMEQATQKYDEELFEHYLELSKKAIEIDISHSNDSLNELCHEIYYELVSISSK